MPLIIQPRRVGLVRQDPYLVVLILLGHGLLLRLSFALVAVVLKPNFHLKEAEAKEHVSGESGKLRYQFQRPTVSDNQFPAHRWFVDGNITTPPSAIETSSDGSHK